MFFFSKGLKVTNISKNESIETSCSNDQVSVFETDKELDEYLTHNKTNYFHEFVNGDYVKLFVDIDCDHIVKHSNGYLEQLSKLLIEYLMDSNDVTITDSGSIDVKSFIRYTKSTNNKKTSYHIIFNNIIILTKDFPNLKKIMINFINVYKKDNKLIEFIDINLYKKRTQLRFIYSLKDNDPNKYFHYPYNPTKDVKIDTKNLCRYSINVTDETKSVILSIDKNTQTEIYFDNEETCEDTPYYIKYLSGLTIIKKIYGIQKNLSLDINFLENIRGFVLNQNILYKPQYCPCGKPHKNDFKISIRKSEIIITKNGNPNSCKLLPIIYKYEKLDNMGLAYYIKDLNILKKFDSDLSMIWNNNKWNMLSSAESKNVNCTFLYHLLHREEDDQIITREIDKLHIFKQHKLFIEMNIVSNDKSVYTLDPYMLKLNNGIYDLKNNVFIDGIDTKHIIKNYGIDINYKHYDKFTEEEKKEYDINKEILMDILNKIILNNKEFAETFKCNVSSSLYSGYKPVINIFVGQTSSGKSTIKLLLKQLFNESYCDLIMKLYYENIDSAMPNPWKGSINNKLISFASEIPENTKFKIENFKDMTEDSVSGRMLFSNNCIQKNNLTQFLDVNFRPSFNFIDEAIKKRICIMSFKSYFYHEQEDENYIMSVNKEHCYKKNENILNVIKSGSLNRVFLDVLISWAVEYHSTTLSLQHSLIMKNKGITDYDIEFQELISKNTVIPNCTENMEDVIIKNKEEYKIYSYDKNKAGLHCSRTYLYSKLISLVSPGKKKAFSAFFNYEISGDLTLRCYKKDINKKYRNSKDDTESTDTESVTVAVDSDSSL